MLKTIHSPTHSHPYSKRMIMTVGDSRVGKSTVIKLLIELLLSENRVIKVYNHDHRSKFKAYERLIPIESLNFFADNPDIVLDDLLLDELDVILVDMPGQYIQEICNYIDEARFFRVLSDFEWKLTFLQPISHRRDCIDWLNQLLDFATDNANYVVVLNKYFDTRFKEYHQSMQQKLSLILGAEIQLTGLHRDHYQAMEDISKPYWLCCGEPSLYVVYRVYIYHWLKNFCAGVKNNQLASKYLGLGNENRRDITGVF